MTPTQTNAAIALLLGICTCQTYKKPGDFETAICDGCGMNPFYAEHSIPNFHGSLDACATFEATLTGEEAVIFRHLLACNSDGRKKTHNTVEAAMCHATAPQRCAAFLKIKSTTPPNER